MIDIRLLEMHTIDQSVRYLGHIRAFAILAYGAREEQNVKICCI